MKLLLDQNLSFRLVKKFSLKFPSTDHVKNIGLTNSSDIEIYQYAKSNNFSIVTFDADFLDIILLKGSPPKLIWLNTGNLTSQSVFGLFETNQETITEFLKSNDSILELNG